MIIDYLHLFFVAKVGKSLKIINYKLLFNRAENRDFTIYKFQEIDNIECGFEDLYQCQR